MTQQKSKRIQGLFAVIIIFHHLSQMVSATWLPDSIRRPGLEFFVPVGYLMVSFFFFCSGYGLTKSMRSKEDYFDGFFVRRLNRVLFVTIIVDIAYIVLRIYKGILAFPPNPFSWYVYTLIILYTGFFIAYRKKTKASFAIMCGIVILYCAACHVLALGNWWFNSVPAFLAGIFIAERENEKSDIKRIVISAVIFAAAFFMGENIKTLAVSAHYVNYGVINGAVVLFQMLASIAFPLLCYYISFKTPGEDKGGKALFIIRKILSFLGGFTLEIYLVHGIFVNVFGPYFISGDVKSYYYIKNIPLYVLLVIVITLPLAFGIKKLFDVLEENYESLKVLNRFMKDLKKIVIVVLVIAVVATAGLGFRHSSDAKEARKQAEEYKDSNITMVDSAGEQIAVYTAGEGRNTAVLVSSGFIPGSTINLRPLADKLAEDYRVVIIDLPGTGFSPYKGNEPTADHYADVIKGTLDALGIQDNIILMPHYFAGVYCYKYISKYPQGLSGAVFINSIPVEIAPRLTDGTAKTKEEYEWTMSRALRSGRIMDRFKVMAGFADFDLVFFEDLFAGTDVKKYVPAMKEFVRENSMNEAHCAEVVKLYANCEEQKGFTLPDNIPVLFLMSSDIKYDDPYRIDWTKCYERMITNKERQTVTVIDNPYTIYRETKTVKKLIDGITGI